MNMSCSRVFTLPARSATQKLFCLNSVSPKLTQLKHKRSFNSSRAAAQDVHDWLGQFQSNQYTTGSTYFKKIIQHTELARTLSSRGGGSSNSTDSFLLNHTDIRNHSLAETATAVAMGNNVSSITQAAANAALCQQHVQLPSSFAVPSHTTVPAYQLVGVFRSMLGYPNLPQAAKATTVEAKWGMLQLVLRHAEGDEQGFAQQLQQLLDEVLLPDALRKVQKVQANPKIPEPNKQSALERYHSLRANCQDAIIRWAAATAVTPAFQQLQPAMLAVSDSVKASLASGNWHCPASSASSGKLMEQTALAVLQASLPPNWSLLPSLHLLGADGQVFAVQQGCKYEADMLVLNEEGVAVAIVEVKLAAANPLMSLFNDVNSLLRLVDQIKGSTITAITRSDLNSLPVAEVLQQEASIEPTLAGPISAASATVVAQPDQCNSVSSTSTGSGGSKGRTRPAALLLAKARAATTQAPFAQGPAWQTVHIRVHPTLVPIYVLGKSIGEAEVAKGLTSLVDSAALKLLSTSSADVAQAIIQSMQAPQDQQQQQAQQESLQAAASNDEGNLSRSDSSDSMGSGGSSSNRIMLGLNRDQQQKIREQVQRRMAVLKECMIYSVCARQGSSAC